MDLCPECDRTLGRSGACLYCGWQRPAEVKPLPIYREPAPRYCEHGVTGQRCARCDATAGKFLEEVKAALPQGEVPQGTHILGEMKPICARCEKEVLPSEWLYSDARLWHTTCASQRRVRV